MPESTLKELIPEKLRKNLTSAELRLLDVAPNGEILDLRAKRPEIDDPVHADAWGTERTIRSEFLRWICTDKKAAEPIDARGIRIFGAKIVGKLDFEGATVNHRLVLAFCLANDGITLSDAKTRTISLQGTHTGRVFGDRLTVEGAFLLRSGFRAAGGVKLSAAKVSGDLGCSGGSFDNKNGDAFSADRIETKGTIFLNKGFSAKGEVRLPGAKVGGGLDCSGGCFVNENGVAFSADRIETNGNIFLNKGFSAKGTVRLPGAKVGGDLDCSGGSFVNENGVAFSADGIETKGDIFLSKGFSAKGEVRLLGAKVGNLFCSGGSFVNENGDALIAQKMIVEGNFTWKLKERPIGEIDLMHAKVGVLTDNKESWPEPGKLHIDGFEYDALAPDNTPKKAKERLTWIELQLKPTKKSIPEILTEPLQNKYPIKWIWIRTKRWLNKVWQNIFESKPYGNFKNRPPFEFRPQPYEQLAKALKNMGHESDSREVLIAKQEALRRSGDISSSRRFWYRFLGITMGYGYKPIRPVLFSLFMVILGCFIFSYAYKNSFIAQSKLSIFKDNMHLYPEFYPVIYSLDTLIPFLDLHQESYWIPTSDHQHPFRSFLIHLYLWIHIILGWFATTLAAVSLSGVVRKKE